MVRFRHNRKKDTDFPVDALTAKGGLRLVDVLTTEQDRAVWEGAGRFQGRDADELDQYLRSYGYQLSRRVYVEGGPDKGRGGELWISPHGFPIKAETRDGKVVKIQRKVTNF